MAAKQNGEPLKKGQDLAVPRLSASLIVINHRNEVLLVHRNPKGGTFAGMHVFPGGNYDLKQDDSLETTAIRETFEETGLLLASSPSSLSQYKPEPSDKELDAAREDIHAQKRWFEEFLKEHEMRTDKSKLMRFTEWVTPVGQPRRFQTQFYLTFLDADPTSGFTYGTKLDRLPTPDGAQEVIAARFVHPSRALQECAERKIGLMPPQFYLVSTLAPLLDGDVSTSEQRARVQRLAEGNFGRMSVNPKGLIPVPEGTPEGYSILTYEGDEARGGRKGRLHRALVKWQKAVVVDVQLQRNFDVFTDIPDDLFKSEAKL